jgi:predicted metal-dependent phosphoesterase TrpH
VATLEREIDRLYALPLDEFTSSRNTLARRLKRDGDPEAADEVAALAKPSVPAWAINQVARREKASMRTLLDAAAKLRKAQERALGGGDADALRAAQSTERDAVRDLTKRAAELLEEAERPASRAVLERIRTTLGAAALTEPGRSALKAGRLTSEVEASGFDALAEIKPSPAQRDELAERREQKAERERERRRLEKRAQQLEARAQEAERKADDAEEAAAEARQAAEERRRDAQAAASELADFERQTRT